MSRENGNAMDYRILKPEEWQRLTPFFEKMKAFLPPEFLATAAVCEVQSRIVGFLVLQCVLHAEPLFIDPEYSGLVDYRRMWKILQDIPNKAFGKMVAPGFLMIAENPDVVEMAKIVGFNPIPGTLCRYDWRG